MKNVCLILWLTYNFSQPMHTELYKNIYLEIERMELEKIMYLIDMNWTLNNALVWDNTILLQLIKSPLCLGWKWDLARNLSFYFYCINLSHKIIVASWTVKISGIKKSDHLWQHLPQIFLTKLECRLKVWVCWLPAFSSVLHLLVALFFALLDSFLHSATQAMKVVCNQFPAV